MERVVQCVRGDFFRGQTLPDLADAQRRVEQRCRSTAGLRVHGTTAQRPAEHFATDGKALLLTLPATPYNVAVFATPQVAPDRYVEGLRALYSVPGELIVQRVEARADSRLGKIYSGGAALDQSLCNVNSI